MAGGARREAILYCPALLPPRLPACFRAPPLPPSLPPSSCSLARPLDDIFTVPQSFTRACIVLHSWQTSSATAIRPRLVAPGSSLPARRSHLGECPIPTIGQPNPIPLANGTCPYPSVLTPPQPPMPPQKSLLGPIITLLSATTIAITAVSFTHYAPIRDREEMRRGVVRDKKMEREKGRGG